jgi:hypothetical protein
LSKFLRFVVLPTAIVVFACKMWGADAGAAGTASSASIIDRYLEAEDTQHNSLDGASMEVDIRASVPNLKQAGRLHALRRTSKVGRISYRVLGFEGDNQVKNQVIARYLQAEQQAQGNQDLAVTPVNYKLRYMGERVVEGERHVYVFGLAPRRKRVGLFKGEIWLDASTYLPVYEKGHFVKNPSIFFRKVEFERAYGIQNGVPVPEHMASTIQTRLVGRVEVNVSYSNFALNDTGAESSSEGEIVERAMGSLP